MAANRPEENTVMRMAPLFIGCSGLLILAIGQPPAPSHAADDSPTATRKFEVKNDRPFLGGKEIDLWGLRCGNALYSDAVTERHVRSLDKRDANRVYKEPPP
jgi:hypothetical protein